MKCLTSGKGRKTMNKPEIDRQGIETIYDNPYISLYDLHYSGGKHYLNASRRSREELAAVKTEEEFKKMVPDAVSCVVIIKLPEEEPKLLLSKEFRYPVGQFVLSVPAGLIDAEDTDSKTPALTAAAREIEEETGLKIKENDKLELINPLLFSTPGMTDESNAIALAVINLEDLTSLTQDGAVGMECFDGFSLLGKEEAEQILRGGHDNDGNFYSVFTWIALVSFVSGLWDREGSR